jgi:hypothetical protein
VFNPYHRNTTGAATNNRKVISRKRLYMNTITENTTTQETTVICRCCGLPITLEYQPRRIKPPCLLITCRRKGCKLYTVTLAVETVADYEARDLSVWGLAC